MTSIVGGEREKKKMQLILLMCVYDGLCTVCMTFRLILDFVGLFSSIKWLTQQHDFYISFRSS